MAENEATLDALFVNLVLVFKSAAMQQMGKTINPLTGKVEKNLDQARFSIDTLEMLRVKTKGNLSGELERLIETALLELRMNYVEEADAAAEAGQAKPEQGAAAEARPKAESPGAPEDNVEPEEVKPEPEVEPDGVSEAAGGGEAEGESKSYEGKSRGKQGRRRSQRGSSAGRPSGSTKTKRRKSGKDA